MYRYIDIYEQILKTVLYTQISIAVRFDISLYNTVCYNFILREYT